MNKLDPKQATSSGTSSEEEFKNHLPIRWSSSKLLETCPSSPDREEESSIDVEEYKQNKCENMNPGIRSCSNNDATESSNTQVQTRRRRQGVVMRCIAEVHTNPSNDDIV